MYVIRVLNTNPPAYVAPWEVGDPPRTLVIDNAQKFKTNEEAVNRMIEVGKTHPFKDLSYEIIKID